MMIVANCFSSFNGLRAYLMSTVPVLIAEEGNESIVIDRPAIVVGRSRRRSDVRIDNRSISAVHCEIAIGENCLQIRNRGLNGIRINGQKSDTGILRDGDVLEIARLKYRVLMKGDTRFPNASELSSSNDWFVRLAGMELGPMPWAELSLMAQRGELTRSDEVRWSQQQKWIPAGSADGLFESDERRSETPDTLAQSDGRSASADPDDTVSNTPEDAQIQFAELDAADVTEEPSNHKDTALVDTAELTQKPTDQTDASVSSLKASIIPLRTEQPDADHRADSKVHRSPESPITNDFGINLTEGLVDASDSSDVPGVELDDTAGPAADQRHSRTQFVPAQPLTTHAIPPPAPRPAPPPFRPIVGKSDTFFDRVYDAVIDPILVNVPGLKAWPAVAVIAAGLMIAFLLTRPSYEGTQVSGVVTLNGRPLADATISFTDLKNGFGASAALRSDGTFEVATLKGGMKPGTYSIAVMPVKPESPEVINELQRQYSEKLNGDVVDESMLSTDGESGLDSSSPASDKNSTSQQLPPGTIPFQYRSIQTSGIEREITEDGPNELLIELVAD